MKIQDLRQDIRMTQKEFAQYVGVSKSTVQKWEYRKCPEYMVRLIDSKIKYDKMVGALDVYECIFD